MPLLTDTYFEARFKNPPGPRLKNQPQRHGFSNPRL